MIKITLPPHAGDNSLYGEESDFKTVELADRRVALLNLTMHELIVQCDKIGADISECSSKDELVDRLLFCHMKLREAISKGTNVQDLLVLERFIKAGEVPQGYMYYFAFPKRSEPTSSASSLSHQTFQNIVATARDVLVAKSEQEKGDLPVTKTNDQAENHDCTVDEITRGIRMIRMDDAVGRDEENQSWKTRASVEVPFVADADIKPEGLDQCCHHGCNLGKAECQFRCVLCGHRGRRRTLISGRQSDRYVCLLCGTS